jgi:hypothetical protein
MKRRNYLRDKFSRLKNDGEYVNENEREQLTLFFRGYIVPDHFYTHVRYTDRNFVIMSTVTNASYIFAGNDIFDPDVTSSGHQPMGFDQLMALYQRFRVHSSLIRVGLVYQSTGCQFGTCPSNATTTPSNLNNLMESPYAKWLTTYNGIGIDAKIIDHMQTKEIVGIKSIDEDDQFAGTSTASPARLWYWILHAETFDTNTTGSMRLNFSIEYDVELFSRINLGQS